MEKSKYHGSMENFYDWKGRTFVDAPAELLHKIDNPLARYRVPSKLVHTWRGHTKAITDVQLFPKTGHLVLSASLDAKIKIWDMKGSRAVRRTYCGHRGGVVGLDFAADGRSFMSAGQDGWVKVWDTESGSCKNRLLQIGAPRVAKYYPRPGEEHTIFVGGAAQDILQFDLRQPGGEAVLRYEGHLRPVNSLTFVDHNYKFASTSDDKSIRFWDIGIPREIRKVADPEMQSMPSSALHPEEAWIAFQSLDNRVLVFEASGRFRVHPEKKAFKGHQVSGFACQLSFSPDGRFLASGSFERGQGSLCIWEWRDNSLVSVLPTHQGQVCIGCRWHPIEPSSIVTWGWDGLMKLWA